MNFFELQRQALLPIGRTPSSADADLLQETKDAINNTIQEIASQEKFWFMRRKSDFLTVANVTSPGDVSVTNGSPTVTGNSTVFTLLMVGRKIRIGSDDIVYTILSFASATSINLDQDYAGTTASGATYNIYQNVYNLSPTFDQLITIKERSHNQFLTELMPVEFDAINPDPIATGVPTRCFILGVEQTEYSTGTVALDSTAVVTGSSTVWTNDEHLNSTFQVAGDNVSYRVVTVTSNTSITLDRAYEGASASASNYTMTNEFPKIFVDPIPSSVVKIEYRHHAIPTVLGNNQDLPDIINKYHWVIVEGSRYRVLTYRKELDRARQYQGNYLRGISTIITQNMISSSRIDQLRGRREAFRRIPSRITLPIII